MGLRVGRSPLAKTSQYLGRAVAGLLLTHLPTFFLKPFLMPRPVAARERTRRVAGGSTILRTNSP